MQREEKLDGKKKEERKRERKKRRKGKRAWQEVKREKMEEEKKNLHARVGRVAKEVKMKKEIRASRKEKSR